MYKSVTITNIITSGSGFAVSLDTGESCFVPPRVMQACGAQIGDVVDAMVIPNPTADMASRTPFMATYVKPADTTRSEPADRYALSTASPSDAAKFTRDVMREGGVWTVALMMEEYVGEHPYLTTEEKTYAYTTISNTLRAMFRAEQCSKWAMWGKASQSKPSREWFSCHPQDVDVVEMEDA